MGADGREILKDYVKIIGFKGVNWILVAQDKGH
jgi:hypothetical protein